MTPAETEPLRKRPLRADAQRNYDKLLAAARAAFKERDQEASLEEIARRAQVGIGTLYRHFPTRQALIEAVYVDEVEAISAATANYAELEPWQALSGWLREYVSFAATKRALSEAMLEADRDAEVFKRCRVALREAGQRLLTRAQEAGEVRPDTTFADVGRLVGGVAMVGGDDEQRERVLALALDGLRYRSAG